MPKIYREAPHTTTPRTIFCQKHGEVPFEGIGDFGPDDHIVTMYCPECQREEQQRHAQHPNSPYPKQGTTPSVIANCNRGD